MARRVVGTVVRAADRGATEVVGAVVVVAAVVSCGATAGTDRIVTAQTNRPTSAATEKA